MSILDVSCYKCCKPLDHREAWTTYCGNFMCNECVLEYYKGTEFEGSIMRQFDTGATRDDSTTPVSFNDYMSLSDAYDKHSKTLMSSKGEEYSVDSDFLCMENRLAGMTGRTPEHVSLVMAGKHITAMGIILDKNKPTEINLEKFDERVRDAINLLKITSAFIHAKQKDFTLHLGKQEVD